MSAQKLPKYHPNELQTLQLQVAQQQAMLAQKDLFIAQQNLQVAMNQLKSAADKVRQENQWDAGVIFNPDNLTFIDPPKPMVIVPSEAK